jgi:hypothetical protein
MLLMCAVLDACSTPCWPCRVTIGRAGTQHGAHELVVQVESQEVRVSVLWQDPS